MPENDKRFASPNSDTLWPPTIADSIRGAFLTAEHLKAMEEEALANLEKSIPHETFPEISLVQVTETLRRIRYHSHRIATIKEQVEELIGPLKAEIARIEEWGRDGIEDAEKRIAFHEQLAVAYYKLNPPAKRTLTLKLPNGRISMRHGKRKWIWEDEMALLAVLPPGHPGVRITASVDKEALKEHATVRDDGTVAETETGEILTGVRVINEPDTYKVEVE